LLVSPGVGGRSAGDGVTEGIAAANLVKTVKKR
jgi:hypothetical protein